MLVIIRVLNKKLETKMSKKSEENDVKQITGCRNVMGYYYLHPGRTNCNLVTSFNYQVVIYKKNTVFLYYLIYFFNINNIKTKLLI